MTPTQVMFFQAAFPTVLLILGYLLALDILDRAKAQPVRVEIDGDMYDLIDRICREIRGLSRIVSVYMGSQAKGAQRTDATPIRG